MNMEGELLYAVEITCDDGTTFLALGGGRGIGPMLTAHKRTADVFHRELREHIKTPMRIVLVKATYEIVGSKKRKETQS
jgi:hypothetical protein